MSSIILPRTYLRILGVNRKQLSQSTTKTGVEYFIELLEKAKRKRNKQNKTTKLKMYIAQQQYSVTSREKFLLQNNSLCHTLLWCFNLVLTFLSPSIQWSTTLPLLGMAATLELPSNIHKKHKTTTLSNAPRQWTKTA